MKVLFLGANSPDPYNKTWGVWNENAVKAITLNSNIQGDFIVPRPYIPRIMSKLDRYNFTKIPLKEEKEYYTKYYPRFVYPPLKKLTYWTVGETYKKNIVPWITKHLEIENYDVIHAFHTYPDGYAATELVKKYGVPLVITIHGPQIIEKYARNRLFSKNIQQTFDLTSSILAVSYDLRKRLTLFDDISEKVKVVSLGVDPEEFKPRPRERAEIIMPKYKLSINDIVILYVGQLIPRKNVKTLLQAASIVLQKTHQEIRENLKFVIVGDGSEKRNLQKLALKLKISNYVIFTGKIPFEELKKWYGIADIFVLPSFSEGKPVAIYEAMSSECAIIASNVNGIPEQVIENVNGFLINPNNAEGLARKLIYLIENEKELERMKKKSRNLLFKLGYTWEEYGTRLKHIYYSVIDP